MKTTRNLKTIKRIVAAMLTLALVLTGISLDSTTAYAVAKNFAWDRTGVESIKDLKDTTVTMKVGDTKSIDYTIIGKGYEQGMTDYYTWTSSDESVVSMVPEYGFGYDEQPKLAWYYITAEKAGTATITATHKTSGAMLSFTVKVKAKKMTAKQKKCKHKWWITKSATCLRSGIKTCKKCKLQKVIAKTGHNYDTVTETKTVYPQYAVYYCPDCGKYFDPYDYGYDYDGDRQKNKEADEAAKMAFYGHACDREETPGLIGQYYFIEATDYDHPIEKTTTVERCTNCGESKEAIEKYYGN